MLVTKDQILHLFLAAGQVMEVILVVSHDLSDSVHQLVSLIHIEWFEN